MQVLFSEDGLGRLGAGQGGVLDAEGLALAYAYPRLTAGQVWVRANFVSTLDGAAAGDDGRSGSINTGADRDVFALLRALSDVVLIGAGTARAEGYRRLTIRSPLDKLRQSRPAHPAIAVFSRSGEVPPDLSQGRDSSGEVILVTCQSAGGAAIDRARSSLGADQVIIAGDASVDLASAVGSLAGRGLPRMLCEGGPHLMGDLTAAGLLDELALTIAPTLIAGDHPRITAGPPVAANLLPRLLIESDGTILGRWSRPLPQT
jgi:riboflavin biosynthesis pyrimidine reductase